MNYGNQIFAGVNTKMRDLEEKQRILKDRLLLIGQNLIETKEETNENFIEVKKDLEIMKQEIKKIQRFIEAISVEFSKFARKEDLEILSNQAKMFQPLEFVTRNELKNLN